MVATPTGTRDADVGAAGKITVVRWRAVAERKKASSVLELQSSSSAQYVQSIPYSRRREN
jgi:hypothetical protein